MKKLKIILPALILFTSSAFSEFNPDLTLSADNSPKTYMSYKNYNKPKNTESVKSRTIQIELGSNVLNAKTKLWNDFFKIDSRLNVLSSFPSSSINLTLTENLAIPENRSIIRSMHHFWDIQIGVGKSWLIKKDITRVSLPFTFIEKNANCVHNGVLIFDIQLNEISKGYFQIGGETCLYFKYDFIGEINIEVEDKDYNEKSVNEYKSWKTNQFPIKSITSLGDSSKSFGAEKEVKPMFMSVYGYFDGKNHYRGGCSTRWGRYPHCSQMLLPSYSLAKSIYASLALDELEKNYPGIRKAKIIDHVPECSNKKWKGVTFEHALDSAVGHYRNEKHPLDEALISERGFFTSLTHAEKIKLACGLFSKKDKPGKKFVYHSTDIYILGTALNNFIKSANSPNSDLYEDIMKPLWDNLSLSHALNKSQRTADSINQTFTAWGLFFLSTDIVSIGNYLRNIAEENPQTLMGSSLQLNNKDRGLDAFSGIKFYNNGFWARKLPGFQVGCKQDVFIPYMEGYGGIVVALMPNGHLYYFFSDGDQFSWSKAAKASSKIKSFCES